MLIRPETDPEFRTFARFAQISIMQLMKLVGECWECSTPYDKKWALRAIFLAARMSVGKF